MGMYTELNIAVWLKKDTPEDIVSIIQSMVDAESVYYNTPDHPFFKADRWRWLFSSDSYCFDGDTHSSLRLDGITHQYVLTVRSNLKNYCYEIELFLNFLCPYIDSHGFIGYERYEEYEEPSLIHKKGEVIYINETAIDSDYVASAEARIKEIRNMYDYEQE